MKQLIRVIRGAALFIGGMIGLSACLIAGTIADLGISVIVWIVLFLIVVIGLLLMLTNSGSIKDSSKTLFLPPKEEKRDEK